MNTIDPELREKLTLEAVDLVELYAGGTPVDDLLQLLDGDWPRTDPIKAAFEGLILYVQLMQASYHVATSAPLEAMPDAARSTARAWRRA